MTALVIGTGPVKVISKPNASQLFTSERLVKFSSALLIMSFASLVSSTATIITADKRNNIIDIVNLLILSDSTGSCDIVGGVLIGSGILIGIVISLNLGGISFQDELGDQTNLPAVITPISVIIAFIVSLLVGLVSGAYPAYRASELDPIEALRSE